MPDIETINLSITGMTCGHCVHAVSTALQAHPGVVAQEVRIGGATVQADLDITTPDALARAVSDAGYEARVAPGSP